MFNSNKHRTNSFLQCPLQLRTGGGDGTSRSFIIVLLLWFVMRHNCTGQTRGIL